MPLRNNTESSLLDLTHETKAASLLTILKPTVSAKISLVPYGLKIAEHRLEPPSSSSTGIVQDGWHIITFTTS